MNKFVLEYTDGAHPMFIEDEPFLSIIPMVNFKVGSMYHVFLSLAQLKEEELGEDRCSHLMSFPLDLNFKELIDRDELALQLVWTWHQKSEGFTNFRFLINKEITQEELKKEGGWEEKRGELLKKRGRVLLATLLLTILPISLDKLAKILNYRSKERYRDDYVKPLKNIGLIQYTLQQANDPNQQYQLTQRGLNFLMGSPI
jgi:hypothetical protein